MLSADGIVCPDASRFGLSSLVMVTMWRWLEASMVGITESKWILNHQQVSWTPLHQGSKCIYDNGFMSYSKAFRLCLTHYQLAHLIIYFFPLLDSHFWLDNHFHKLLHLFIDLRVDIIAC